jgi:hypothetical protein
MKGMRVSTYYACGLQARIIFEQSIFGGVKSQRSDAAAAAINIFDV